MNSVRAGACRAVFRRGGHIHSLHVMEREKQRDERVVGLMEVTVAAEERCRKRGRQWQAVQGESRTFYLRKVGISQAYLRGSGNV